MIMTFSVRGSDSVQCLSLTLSDSFVVNGAASWLLG